MTGRPSPAEQRELNRRARAQQAAELEPSEPAMRHAGDPGDPPPWRPPEKKLVIVEHGGKRSEFSTAGSDPVYVRVEWSERSAETPWIPERIDSRFGLSSIESMTLEDINEEVT